MEVRIFGGASTDEVSIRFGVGGRGIGRVGLGGVRFGGIAGLVPDGFVLGAFGPEQRISIAYPQTRLGRLRLGIIRLGGYRFSGFGLDGLGPSETGLGGVPGHEFGVAELRGKVEYREDFGVVEMLVLAGGLRLSSMSPAP